MPRISRTILPRIRKSIEERGLWVSIGRSVLLPIHLLREYRQNRTLKPARLHDSFDQEHGLDTAGEHNGWTYLSDLEIPSKNWIHGNNYAAIEPTRFRAAMAKLPVRLENFVFVDFGSGKGRALVMAAEFPFKRIVGVEFSPELHAVAQTNIQKYESSKYESLNSHGAEDASERRIESVCMDFLDFPLEAEPSVLFLFDPCDEYVLGKLLARMEESLRMHPREVYLLYAAPTSAKEQMLDTAPFLTKIEKNSDYRYSVYRNS
ncbi:MAG TPA: class I SAM-dependent methyltransferase [Terriglobales bacterium]|nr:class I SAM-dependent methyltransferase [Terriglobales bacterium]